MNRRRFLWGGSLMLTSPFLAAAQGGQASGQGAAQPARRGGGMTRGPIGGSSEGLQPLDGGKIGNMPAMKITDIKTFLVGAGGRNWVYVKVLTDQGIYGIGEAYSAGPDEAMVKVIEDFKLWLVGNDPRNVQYLFDLMYNTTRFPGGIITNSAMSGIEHALWDIAGKSVGVPVWALLGGRMRNKIRVYQSTGGATPQQAGDNAKAMIEKYGYTALKMGIQAARRRAIQPGDSRFGRACRRRTRSRRPRRRHRRRHPHEVFRATPRHHDWRTRSSRTIPSGWKSPIRPENYDAMKKLSDHVNIPLASGESNYGIYEFKQLIERQALDIVQPDICCCGGVLTMKKIAAMAEAQYIMVAPHNPMSPLATAVNVHFAASTPNFLILEYSAPDSGARRNVLKEPIMVNKDGYVDIPNKPGWGVELNEEAFKSMPPAPWRRGTSFREDGSPYFQ